MAVDEHSWPVIGHQWAVRLLQSSLARGRLPHAILFTGASQVGKTTLALAVAATLNCTSQPKPCGTCRSCRKIARGVHPDVRLVQAESGKGGRQGILKIDQVRQLQREATLGPMESQHKVFVLRELEHANLPAANALLKTLEEPPSRVTLLLTSAHPHGLLPTVVSRCQILALRPLPIAQVEDALRNRWQAEPAQAALLARLSAGRLGWAVERLTDSQAWQQRGQRLADAGTLAGQGRMARLDYAESLSRSPEAILPTLVLWSGWWRDLLLIQQGCPQHVHNLDLIQELERQAARFRPGQVRSFLARLSAAQIQLGQNVNTRLLLETLLLRLPAPVA